MNQKSFLRLGLEFGRACAVGLVFTVMMAVGACVARAQSSPPADLDSYVARALKTFEVPGIAVAIVKDGKIILAKGYGVRRLGETPTVDADTLFGIGSNTKAFTTAALATLVDDGKISWDDPVYQRLPGFQMYDPYVSHEMTIRDLLCHRSGMGLGEGDLLFWPNTTFTRDDIIYRLRFMKPATSFRSHYAYDNLLYLAAGQIIPAVTGKSWEDYIREHILTPLGMTHSTLTNANFKAGDNVGWPHSRLDGKLQSIPFVPLDNAAPAGSINSSVNEMSKWVLLQLGHGKFPGRDSRLFSEKQSAEMWSAQTILSTAVPSQLAAMKPKFSAYGLGWGLRDYHGRKLVGHSGGVAGTVTRVMLVPEENLGVVVLTNAEEEGAFESVLFHILDHYFGVSGNDWIASFKAAKDADVQEAQEITKQRGASRATDSKPSLPLAKYAGVYHDAWYGTATMRFESGKLVFALDHTPRAVGDVEHWQFETFKVHWRDRVMEDAFLTFTLKPDGAIDHFTVQAVSPLADFSFDYQDLYFTPGK
jgi:CubicO group peptidase (beta-lactamase class C family)